MTAGEILIRIEKMSIEEKIAALSPTDKAYIKGYVERAVLESRRRKPRRPKKKAAKNEAINKVDESNEE